KGLFLFAKWGYKYMDVQLLLEYDWIVGVLGCLEGMLAADNALILAVMVKHVPELDQKKALFYELVGAFVFRVISLFLIYFLVDVLQVQAIRAVYLLYVSGKHLYDKAVDKKKKKRPKTEGSGFWMTVFKVEVADMAFAVDSILAAVALAVSLPATGLFSVGSLDGAEF